MKKRKHKSFSSIWMCGLRSASAVIMSVLLVTSQAAVTTVDERQPSAAEIVQPMAKAYQELQQALAGPAPKTPVTPDQIAARLDKLFPMLEKAEKQIPRDTFDPQAIIDKVGKDPKKIFEWVRDNTYFVPYRGLLRGDKGVLMDRLGNSLDRAMLLYSLLKLVDQPARMLRGTLTEAQAANVLAKVRAFQSFDQRAGSTASRVATEESIQQYAQQNHLDALRIRKALEQLTEQQKHMKETVQKRAAAQTAMIAAVVGPPRTNATDDESAEQVKAVTDHWWVQWQNGGRWTDFDPTMPTSQPGETMTSMRSTVSPNAYVDVGEDLVHTVQIQVVIEVWKEGQLKEVPVLTQKLVAAELIDKPISLHQIPVHWPHDLDLTREKNLMETLKKTVLAQTEWLPILSVGPENISKYSFDEYGALNDSTAAGGNQGIAALGQGIGNMLGQHQIPSNQPIAAPAQGRSPNAPQVTAEWIEYDIRTPGRPSQVIRRDIFDLIGPAIRSAKTTPKIDSGEAARLDRGLKLMSEIEILSLASQLSAPFCKYLALENTAANKETLPSLIRMSYSRNSNISAQVVNLKRFPNELYLFVLVRTNASLLHGNFLYLDKSNIVTYYRSLKSDVRGAVLSEEGYDIVENHMAVYSPKASNPFRVRLEQGVLDTTVEAVLAAAHCVSPEDKRSCGEIENTAESFASSTANDSRWLFFADVREFAKKHPEMPRDEVARVQQDLVAGYAVLVPGKELTVEGSKVSWWRVNPITGDVLGLSGYGRGQAGSESTLVKGLGPTLVALLPTFLMFGMEVYCHGRDERGLCHPCAFMGYAGIALLVGGFMLAPEAVAESAVPAAWVDLTAGIIDAIRYAGDCFDWLASGAKRWGSPTQPFH